MAGITFHQVAIVPVLSGLKNAHFFINKGYEHAKAQNIDSNDFLTARLHPDMLDFIYQVQRFTDSAKFIPSRVNPAIEGMSLPDEEKTFPELLARIEKTIKYLESIDPSSFEGREGAEVPMKFGGGTIDVKFNALQYVTQFAQPNFWFHVTTAYGLLRMKGVDVGKFDFLNGAKLITMTTVKKE
ncbi:Nn.00g003050.m01.CDS01 [Neocucurbitaria sp. VM-36]